MACTLTGYDGDICFPIGQRHFQHNLKDFIDSKGALLSEGRRGVLHVGSEGDEMET